jgi:hypothetical protein
MPPWGPERTPGPILITILAIAAIVAILAIISYKFGAATP